MSKTVTGLPAPPCIARRLREAAIYGAAPSLSTARFRFSQRTKFPKKPADLFETKRATQGCRGFPLGPLSESIEAAQHTRHREDCKGLLAPASSRPEPCEAEGGFYGVFAGLATPPPQILRMTLADMSGQRGKQSRGLSVAADNARQSAAPDLSAGRRAVGSPARPWPPRPPRRPDPRPGPGQLRRVSPA